MFPILWTVVSPFIDENTRKKFIVYSSTNFSGLSEYIDQQYIPEFLGGNCKVRILATGYTFSNAWPFDMLYEVCHMPYLLVPYKNNNKNASNFHHWELYFQYDCNDFGFMTVI